MFEDYKSIEFQLYGLFIQLREMFKSNNIGENEIEKINEYIELIQSRRLNVAVMGEFKRGKSSLINALLGLKVLPADVTPATATINRITYGTSPSMTIYYHGGTKEEADMSKISDYVTMLTEEGLRRAAKIREAVIRYPTVICQNHVDIIDTPGLNDNADMTRVTMRLLQDIDAVIVVVSALSPFSEKERDFVCELIKSENIENVVFVVTYIDQVDEEEQDKFIAYIHNRICSSVTERLNSEEVTKYLQQKAERILSGSRIFGVSSTQALKSFITGDRVLLRQSRFENFKNELFEILTAEQSVNTVNKAVKGIHNACRDFERLCGEKISTLDTELKEIEICTAEIEAYCGECNRRLQAMFCDVENKSKGVLNSINNLSGILVNLLTNSFLRAQGRTSNEIINGLSDTAGQCFEIANGDFTENIKAQIITIFTSAIENYKVLRSRELITPQQRLNNLSGFTISYTTCFESVIRERMASFGYPKFKWQVSPIPNINYLNNYNVMGNISHAVNLSVNTLLEHWTIYVSAAKRWWFQQIITEANSAGVTLKGYLAENYEMRKNELLMLKNTYAQQRSTIPEILLKVDMINGGG